MPQKQVPEGQVPSKDEQHQLLLEKMAGNDVFKRQRGKLGASVLDVLLELIKTSTSRSEFRKRFDDLHGDLRVLGNWLAKYHLDGWEHAFEALVPSLREISILLPKEIVSLDETIPITVIMFEPEKTIMLLKFLTACNNPLLVYQYAEMYMQRKALFDQPIEVQEDFPDILMPVITALNTWHQILEAFPTLRKACFDDQVIDFNPDPDDLNARPVDDLQKAIEKAYQHDILDKFDIQERIRDGSLYPIRESGQSRFHPAPGIFDSTTRKYDLRIQCMIGWDAEPKQLLKFYTRKQQKRMAVWHIDLPGILKGLGLVLGVHEEGVHLVWQKEYPAICSKGVSHGLGAITLMSDKKRLVEKYKKSKKENSSVLHLLFE